MLKVTSYILSVTLVFVFLQSLIRPALEIRVSDEELGMALEDQIFFSQKEVDIFLKKEYEKRELMLEQKLQHREEKLVIFKNVSWIFILLSFISVFIFSGKSHLYIFLFFLSFTVVEIFRFGLTEIFFGLIVISFIHLVFYMKRHDGKLPEGWDSELNDKFKK